MKTKKKYRTSIIWFSIYVALMLFQTPVLYLGAITAGILTIGIILSVLLENHMKLRINRYSFIFFIWFCYVALNTIVHGYGVLNLYKILANILIFIVMVSFQWTEEETQFIQNVFLIATCIYALLIIRSCMLDTSRYYHGKIILFSTNFDPNYIGIPLAVSVIITLNIIFLKQKYWYIIPCGICLVAIAYTASRGTMLSILIGFVFLLIINSKGLTLKKLIHSVLAIALCGFGVLMVINYFPAEWSRMTNLFFDTDGNGRLELWKNAIQNWATSPFFGHGISSFYNNYGMVTHNTYLMLLSETGLTGLLLFLVVPFFALWNLFKSRNHLFTVMIVIMTCIFFLDALDNRCMWIFFVYVYANLKIEMKKTCLPDKTTSFSVSKICE